MDEHIHNTIKVALDWVAGIVSVSTIAGLMPVILALPSAFYACLRIYDWFKARK